MNEAQAARLEMRSGRWSGMTVHRVPGFVQCNLVILPAADADEFKLYCDRNPQACPLIEKTEPGDPEPRNSAPGADLRTDLARYSVFVEGKYQGDVEHVKHLWRDDSVAFLLGSSLSFDSILAREGVPKSERIWVLRTGIPTEPAGRFRGPLVVTMRWMTREHAETARRVAGRYPLLHGAPVHVGDPAAIGADLRRPISGDPVDAVPEGVTPVFWACGVSPQVAVQEAKPSLMISHASGYGFITDLKPETFCTG